MARAWCSAGNVEAGAAGIVADILEIFLFDKTVVVFRVGASSGKGDMVGIASEKEGSVDKLRAIVAVDIQKGKGKVGLDVRKGFQDPFLGFIKEWAEFDLSGGDIGGIQSRTKLPGIPFTTVDRFPSAPLPPFGRSRFEFDRLTVHPKEGLFPL